MTANHKPVENKDLVQPILAKIEERTLLNVKTLFEWVKGHSNDPGNEAADLLARNGATRIDAGERVSKGLAEQLADMDDDVEEWGGKSEDLERG